MNIYAIILACIFFYGMNINGYKGTTELIDVQKKNCSSAIKISPGMVETATDNVCVKLDAY